jgi:hypothetical protein
MLAFLVLYGMDDSIVLGCYQIPNSSILSKIASTERQRTEQKAPDEAEAANDGEDLCACQQNATGNVVPIEEMTLDDVHKLRSRSLRAYLKSYGQKKIPNGKVLKRELLIRLVQDHLDQERQNDRLRFLTSVVIGEETVFDPATSALHSFADLVTGAAVMPPETRRVVEDAMGVSNVIVENDLPAFSPSFQHLYFDLRGTACFPSELYRLVQRAEALVITHIISWQSKGKSFAVHDIAAFEKRILEKCCGDGVDTYETFVENLRGFGFVEIKGGSRKGGFRHEYFRRKRPADIALISAVEEDAIDENGSQSESSSSEFEEPVWKPLGKSEKLSTPAARVTGKVQSSGPKKYNLSNCDDFPTELHRLLEDAEDQGLEDVIGWTPTGTAFVISNEELFVKKILLRHSTKPFISSFEALLIRFGFRKTRKIGNDRRYLHPNFMKGDPDSARLIVADSSASCSLPKKACPTPSVVQISKKRKIFMEESGCRRGKKEAQGNQNNSRNQTTSSKREPPSPLHWKGNVVDSLRLLLDSTDRSSPIRWLSDGASFAITNPREFESRIMPQYVL